MTLQVMAWDKNSQKGQFITGLDAERVIVNEMRKKVGFQFIYNHCFFHFGANITYTRLKWWKPFWPQVIALDQVLKEACAGSLQVRHTHHIHILTTNEGRLHGALAGFNVYSEPSCSCLTFNRQQKIFSPRSWEAFLFSRWWGQR